MRLIGEISILLFLFCSKGNERKLDLSDKNLTEVPDSVFEKTALEYLNVGSGITLYPPLSVLVDRNSNHILELSSKIGYLKNLRTLILSCNRLKSLPDSITNLEKLQTLDLSFNRDFDIRGQIEKISRLKSLSQLMLVNVNMVLDDTDLLKKYLSPNTKIIFTIQDYANTLKKIKTRD